MKKNEKNISYNDEGLGIARIWGELMGIVLLIILLISCCCFCFCAKPAAVETITLEKRIEKLEKRVEKLELENKELKKENKNLREMTLNFFSSSVLWTDKKIEEGKKWWEKSSWGQKFFEDLEKKIKEGKKR